MGTGRFVSKDITKFTLGNPGETLMFLKLVPWMDPNGVIRCDDGTLLDIIEGSPHSLAQVKAMLVASADAGAIDTYRNGEYIYARCDMVAVWPWKDKKAAAHPTPECPGSERISYAGWLDLMSVMPGARAIPVMSAAEGLALLKENPRSPRLLMGATPNEIIRWFLEYEGAAGRWHTAKSLRANARWATRLVTQAHPSRGIVLRAVESRKGRWSPQDIYDIVYRDKT